MARSLESFGLKYNRQVRARRKTVKLSPDHLDLGFKSTSSVRLKILRGIGSVTELPSDPELESTDTLWAASVGAEEMNK
jgi:hypothetical protein